MIDKARCLARVSHSIQKAIVHSQADNDPSMKQASNVACRWAALTGIFEAISLAEYAAICNIVGWWEDAEETAAKFDPRSPKFAFKAVLA